MRVIFVALLILLSKPSTAHDLGVYGSLYPIAEENALHMLYKKLQHIAESGSLDNLQEQVTKKVAMQVDRPPGIAITSTRGYREYYIDLTTKLNQDIINFQGKVIFKKDTTFNSLAQTKWQQNLVFIDADNEQHITWVKNHLNNKIVLVSGSIAKTAELLNTQIYFDQAGILTKKFGIKQIPAIVSKKDNKLFIQEVLP